MPRDVYQEEDHHQPVEVYLKLIEPVPRLLYLYDDGVTDAITSLDVGGVEPYDLLVSGSPSVMIDGVATLGDVYAVVQIDAIMHEA